MMAGADRMIRFKGEKEGKMRMMTMNKTILALLMALSVTTAVFGAVNVSPEQLGCQDAREILAAGGNLELGHWYIDWTSCKTWCDEHNVPMLAVWSNTGCSRCYDLGLCFLSEEFKAWAATHDAGKVIYCYMNGGVSGYPDQRGDTGYNWAKKVPSSLDVYPFVSIYWKGHGTAQQQGVILHKTGDQFRSDKNGDVPKGHSIETTSQSVDNIVYWMETTLADWSPLHGKDNPIDLSISYGLCEKNGYNLMEGTNWFRIAGSAEVKYAVRLLTDDEKYADFRFSLVTDDPNAKPLSADLGLGLEFAKDKDGDVLFGVEAVRPNGVGRGSVGIDLQFVAMDPDTATCFPEVSMQYASSCGCEEPRECDYKGWNIVPDGALVTGTATVGKVMWADADRELVYPKDLLKSPLAVNSKKTIWMQALASNYIRSTKVSASFALGKCNQPTCSCEPVTGDYGPQRVILGSDAGTEVRYTVDGSDVTETSPVYTKSFVVQETTTVKARTYRTDWVESDCATFVVDDGRREIGDQGRDYGDFYEYYLDGGQLKVRFVVRDGEGNVVTADDYAVSFSVNQGENGEEPTLVLHFQGFNRYKGESEETISLPSDKFAEVDGLIWFYRKRGGAVEIVSGPMGVEELRIPEEIDGLPVSAIGPSAFAYARIRKLVVPSAVTRIEDGAFWCCTDLETVEGTSELEYVGSDAFCETPFLSATEEATPDGSIIMIGGCAMRAKGELTGSVSFPGTTRGIANGAFACQQGLTQVVLPDGIRSIGRQAFEDCGSLAEVNFPETLVWVDEGALSGTPFLDNLFNAAPAAANSLIIVGNVLLGVKDTLSDAVKIPEHVRGVAARAFADAEGRGGENVTSIALPPGLQAIGPHAFQGCWSLASIRVPASIARVSSEAFSDSGIVAVLTEDDEGADRIREQLYPNALPFIGKEDSFNMRQEWDVAWTKDNGVFRSSEFVADERRGSSVLALDCFGRGTLKFKWAIRQAGREEASDSICDGVLSIRDDNTDNLRVVKTAGIVSGGSDGTWNESSTEIELYENGLHSILIGFSDEDQILMGDVRIEVKDVEWVPAAEGLGVVVKLDPNGGTLATSGTLTPGIAYGFLPQPVRIGANFIGWTDQDLAEIDDHDPWSAHLVQEGDSTPLVPEVTLHALWERYEPSAHEGEWHLTRNGFYSIVDPVDGGQCSPGYSRAVCSYETPGRGWIGFKWRVVSAEDTAKELYAESGMRWSSYSEGQRLVLWTDASMDLFCDYHEKGWKTERVAVSNGDPMEYVWEFENDRTESVVVEIEDVTWEWAPEDFNITVTLDPCGGTLLDDNQVVCGKTFTRLPTPEREDASFVGWTTENYGDPHSCTIVGEGNWTPLANGITLYAVWDVSVESALDPYCTIRDGECGNRLEMDGMDYYRVSAHWNLVVEEDEEGEPIWETMRQEWAGERVNWSCQLTRGEERDIVRAYVHGCGIYHFSSLSCGYSDMACRVYVDGVLQDLDSEFKYNDGSDADVEIREKPGCFARYYGLSPEDADYDLHEIRVAVLFKGSKSTCGYEESRASGGIGPMRWTAAPASIDVTFDGRGGSVSGGEVRTFVVGSAYGTFPSACRENCEFLGWFTEPDGGEQVFPTELIHLSATRLYARWKTDLITALGGKEKRRFAARDGDWIGTADLSHGSNGVCATTGELTWGATNVMTTVVQGRGLLSFWWMQGEDLSNVPDDAASLTLWLDGKLIAECRGTSAWKHMTLPVLGKGNHKVEWKYTPGTGYVAIDDGWDYYGYLAPMQAWKEQGRMLRLFSDGPVYAPGAWVDEVAWTPGSDVKGIVPWARGVAEGHGWLTEQLPLIEAEYTAKIADEPHNYVWRILRAMTKICGLGENENLKAVLAQFGLTPDYQVLGNFFGELDYFDAPLSNEVVDDLAAEAVPVLESALADLDAIPGDWTGTIPLDPAVYPVDAMTYVDPADVTLCKAVLKGALSALAIAEGYDLSVDYMNGEMEEILAEAGLPVTFEYLVEDHPEFAKRVRDAERLGEGKEILRDALETLQTSDGLMLARTTSELHFFEYDEKDAEKQQYAREEVAKMLVALDGETVITTDDFRPVRDIGVSEMNQPVTLVPFFAGNVTRRYLPTEIHGNAPVFDSFPTMSFGGTFPGLTKDIVAGWLSECGYEVEYTPNSDYEPEMPYRTFNAAIPNLGASATEEEIKDALAGTADEKVKANISDAASYAAYETWAKKVQSTGVSLKAVKASPYSWQSFALAVPGLVQNEITDDDLKVEEFKPSSESGKFEFTVSVKDVTVGSEAVEENLKQMVGLEGAESLGEAFRSENVAIKFGQPEDGKLKFTAEPKNKDTKSFFMKMKVK